MSVLIALRAAYRALSVVVESELGATDARLHLVRTLAERGPLGQAEIARITRLDPASITRQLQALERDRLVSRRTPNLHAGAKVVRLTPAGLAWFEAARARREALEAALFEDWEAADLDRLAESLGRLEERARLRHEQSIMERNAA